MVVYAMFDFQETAVSACTVYTSSNSKALALHDFHVYYNYWTSLKIASSFFQILNTSTITTSSSTSGVSRGGAQGAPAPPLN